MIFYPVTEDELNAVAESLPATASGPYGILARVLRYWGQICPATF